MDRSVDCLVRPPAGLCRGRCHHLPQLQHKLPGLGAAAPRQCHRQAPPAACRGSPKHGLRSQLRFPVDMVPDTTPVGQQLLRYWTGLLVLVRRRQKGHHESAGANVYARRAPASAGEPPRHEGLQVCLPPEPVRRRRRRQRRPRGLPRLRHALHLQCSRVGGPDAGRRCGVALRRIGGRLRGHAARPRRCFLHRRQPWSHAVCRKVLALCAVRHGPR
mmetsp:Transcript_93397/g.263653  ORF Transcript_93397/g.263653 Transcript_93397/m.263653 type:complete len:217 (-) Transcript_93397:1069-1719(-)